MRVRLLTKSFIAASVITFFLPVVVEAAPLKATFFTTEEYKSSSVPKNEDAGFFPISDGALLVSKEGDIALVGNSHSISVLKTPCSGANPVKGVRRIYGAILLNGQLTLTCYLQEVEEGQTVKTLWFLVRYS